MKINRSNYESYFIDYLDGNLPDNLVDDLLDFLAENPELANELNVAKNIHLKPQTCTFNFKETLYKHSTNISEDFEMQAVAYLEGDLNEENNEQFLNQIADDSAKLQTLHLLKQAKLKPQSTIEYPNKKKLLHHPRKTFSLWASRIAALLLIFFSVWALIPRKQPVVPDNPIAFKTEEQQAPFSAKTADKKASIVRPKPVADASIKVTESTEKELAKVESAKQLPTPVAETRVREVQPTRLAIPEQIQPLKAQIEPLAVQSGELHIRAANNKLALQKPAVSVDEYLAHKIINAPKGESFTFNNLANAGLNAVENLTNERFNVERTENGKLKQIKFDSRLIAFSIPFKKNR
ncbi:hypothetical protein [Mangrovibacterium marinum]|uniref:Uncharacterized protein n=1 Tax=Mangrovibacterium marinum TaxID=1639118 RepID=A0A2T5C2J7_9BACT|nr:hypothetical protein [Mangrovibacterium marinum]PTN08954.1 hypothetical protein C8N47_10651 [Mangrovibacterium marinum]